MNLKTSNLDAALRVINLDSSGLLRLSEPKTGGHSSRSIRTFKTDFAKTGIDYSKVKRILVNMMAGTMWSSSTTR